MYQQLKPVPTPANMVLVADTGGAPPPLVLPDPLGSESVGKPLT